MKSGFVSIIGRPNVGKSTLLNAMVGEKVAIATDKPQTTRNRIRGIYNEEDLQIVFLDTPGIHKPKSKLGEFMTGTALSSFNDVDAILFLVDEPHREKGGDYFIFNNIKDLKMPKILIINKMDKMKPEQFKEIFDGYDKTGVFDQIIGTVALDGAGVPAVIDAIKPYMEEGPAFFDPGMYTDHPERFIVSEIIREKVLLNLEDEIPHGTAIEIENYEELPRLTRISCIIYTEKKSHKGMIIGKGGLKLKEIGKSAREEIEALVGTKVYLELFVKVKENWRDSTGMLSNLGYKE
ncbi:MAG: GTPase Era [Clostridiales Family XIII bacterium]|jgi:GTP-binding protein Era|nr:GTPase Era [Clostridiales Family XIII bacterium]